MGKQHPIGGSKASRLLHTPRGKNRVMAAGGAAARHAQQARAHQGATALPAQQEPRSMSSSQSAHHPALKPTSLQHRSGKTPPQASIQQTQNQLDMLKKFRKRRYKARHAPAQRQKSSKQQQQAHLSRQQQRVSLMAQFCNGSKSQNDQLAGIAAKKGRRQQLQARLVANCTLAVSGCQTQSEAAAAAAGAQSWVPSTQQLKRKQLHKDSTSQKAGSLSQTAVPEASFQSRKQKRAARRRPSVPVLVPRRLLGSGTLLRAPQNRSSGEIADSSFPKEDDEPMKPKKKRRKAMPLKVADTSNPRQAAFDATQGADTEGQETSMQLDSAAVPAADPAAGSAGLDMLSGPQVTPSQLNTASSVKADETQDASCTLNAEAGHVDVVLDKTAQSRTAHDHAAADAKVANNNHAAPGDDTADAKAAHDDQAMSGDEAVDVNTAHGDRVIHADDAVPNAAAVLGDEAAPGDKVASDDAAISANNASSGDDDVARGEAAPGEESTPHAAAISGSRPASSDGAAPGDEAAEQAVEAEATPAAPPTPLPSQLAPCVVKPNKRCRGSLRGPSSLLAGRVQLAVVRPISTRTRAALAAAAKATAASLANQHASLTETAASGPAPTGVAATRAHVGSKALLQHEGSLCESAASIGKPVEASSSADALPQGPPSQQPNPPPFHQPASLPASPLASPLAPFLVPRSAPVEAVVSMRSADQDDGAPSVQSADLEVFWGVPAGGEVGLQPVRDTLHTMMRQEGQHVYNKFRKPSLRHYPPGTSKSMQGLFSLLKAFDSIKDHDQELQRQLLTHSQDLYDLSRESAVHLLRHNVRSAGQLMGLLQEHAPKEPGEDHLLMLQGPLQDMEPRQVCMVRNHEVMLKCDAQTSKAWTQSWGRTSAAEFCDCSVAAELAMQAFFPRMQHWASELQVAWDLQGNDPLGCSCVVEALMAAWTQDNLPVPAAQASIPYAHQVDVSQEEGALGPGQKGAGPTLYGTPGAPLPCHGEDLSRIPAGFCYTPDSWSSLSATALSCGDDGCGASMAQCHATQQPATDLQGVSSACVILSSLLTRTNFHVEDSLFGAYNILCHGAPKIWYVVPPERSTGFEAALQEQHGPQALAALTAKHMYCSLPVAVLKDLGVKRFLQMPGYAVITYPGPVYHWTISTGFSMAEASNMFVGQPDKLLSLAQDWYATLYAACQQTTKSKKKERAELKSSLKNRVHISEAIMEYLMQGPLREGQSPALHGQASDVLQSLCHLKLSLETSS